MVSPKSKIKFTYEDYRNTPEDKRYELLDGELVMVPSPKEQHQRLSIKLAMRLQQFVEETGMGYVYTAPFDVVLSDTDVVQPDLLFVSRERRQIITDDNIQGAPDVVVEILSQSTAERDRTYKRSLYARYGVQEYWIADPETRTVEVLRLGERGFESEETYGVGQTLVSPQLEGLNISLDEVF